MPDEPNRKIEELLKRYAQKRREDAGASSELHPAARRLLQAEVARLRPRTEPQSAHWLQVLLRSWRGLAMATCIAFFLAGGVWTLVWSQRGASRNDQMARHMAESNTLKADKAKAAGAAGSARENKESLVEITRLAAEETSPANPGAPRRDEWGITVVATNLGLAPDLQLAQTPPPADASGKSEVADLLSLAPTQPGPAEGPLDTGNYRLSLGVPLVFLDGPAANQPLPGWEHTGGQSPVFRYNEAEPRLGSVLSKDPTLAAAKPEATVPAQSEVGAKLAEEAKTTFTRGTSGLETGRPGSVESDAYLKQARQRYSQVAPPAQPAAAGAVRSILTSFEVEQTGERLRIYDSDGSVYEGRLLAGDVAGKRPAIAPPQEALQEGQENLARRSGDRGASTPQRASGFTVLGTNRTLNQQVELRGEFVGEPPARAAFRGEMSQQLKAEPLVSPSPAPVLRQQGAAASQTAVAPAAGTAVQSAPDQNPSTRIRGKVRIGTNQETDLDAIPVVPR